MLRANQAVRLGLRAASRNPELAFARALLDVAGNVLTLLPVLLVAVAMTALLAGDDVLQTLARAAAAAQAVRWPLLGALVCASALGWTLGMAFWSGALPVLAADAEMDARPPAGNFFLLAWRGFARVLGAGAVGQGLALLFSLTCTAALVLSLPLLTLHPRPALFAGVALVLCAALVGGVVLDLLSRLMLVRAAALGDGVAASFAQAARLLGARLSACLLIALAFLVLEVVVATAGGLLSGALVAGADAGAQLMTLAPRIAVGLASGVVFSWLEVGRQGALAALAADAEGLITPPAPPVRAGPAPDVLERPRRMAPREERVVEALPVPDEAVVEALPVPETAVVDVAPAGETPDGQGQKKS